MKNRKKLKNLFWQIPAIVILLIAIFTAIWLAGAHDISRNFLAAQPETPINVDRKIPQISLTGGSVVYVKAGEQWQESFQATDDRDGDLTEKVKVSGNFDLGLPGEYFRTYSVSDTSGNTAHTTRKIVVYQEKIPVPDPAAGLNHVIYLTFDDGPGPHTARLLDILQARNVKATFFVTCNSPQELIGRAARAGHAIGVHTCSHDYSDVYASDAAFWADFQKISTIIKSETGQETKIMRFPGGSSNTVSRRYSPGIMTRLAQQVTERGYAYFDWNVSSGDASPRATKESVLAALKNGVQGKSMSNILCHDIHSYTVDAIPEFLDWALANGYTFLALTAGSEPVHHPLAN